ncbi:hypothetical protein MOP88_19625 [Sphingomonas sp. WKB10]|nr:hypothetical protein [Sphingomonas sp. WKB10]
MPSNETIIAKTLGRAPDRSVNIGAWQFARWRQFIGSYELPALVDPVFVVHVGGKPDTRLWEADQWSKSRSIPGCATIVPAGSARAGGSTANSTSSPYRCRSTSCNGRARSISFARCASPSPTRSASR